MKRNNKKNAIAFDRDSKKDSVPATAPVSENIEKIEKEMEEFIAQSPYLKKKNMSLKERLDHANSAHETRQKKSERSLGEKLYVASYKIDESLDGFRHVAEEIATAIALLASLLHARLSHAFYGLIGKTKKTYGNLRVDRKFESRVEGVFDRLTDLTFGRLFEDIRGKRRYINRKLDQFAQAKIRFGKKLEAGLDKMIAGFAANKKRGAIRIACGALCLMLCCVTVQAGTVYNYSYHDIQLGTVKDKAEVEQAVTQVKIEKPAEANVSVAVNAEPDVDITYEKQFSISTALDTASLDSTEAVAEKISNLEELVADGFAINVDGITVAMVDTEETANRILDTVKQKYVTVDDKQAAELQEILKKIAEESAEQATGETGTDAVVTAAVTRNIVLNESANTTASIVADPAAEVTDVAADLSALQTTVKTNILRKLSFDIIEKLGLNIEMFAGVTMDNIRFAEEVTVEPVKAKLTSFSDFDTAIKNFVDEDGFSTKLTVATSEIIVEEEVIKYEVIYVDDDTLYEGQERIEIPGVNGSQKILYEVTKTNGEEIDRAKIDTQVITEPSPATVRRGTKEKPKCVATGDMQWPCQGDYASPFGRRWGRLHGGIDICNSVGTPIYAADGGKVIFSGWNKNGYGYLVKIDHGNGLQTFYAHNSELLVSEGEDVFKGQQIAKMGSTGRSSGSHCHFEVHVNGKKVDPIPYL